MGKRNQPSDVPPGTNESMAPKPKKQYVPRSDVWDHFDKPKDSKKVSCNYCKSVFKHESRSGTTVLWNHNKICKEYKASLESTTQQNLVNSSEASGQLVAIGFNQDACRKATAKMIVLDELPFTFVERPGFTHFCEIAVPKFVIPSRTTITKDIVQMYVNEKAILMSLFSKSKQRLCLTTDLWTATTTSISYMVITAHFVDENWDLQRKIISFKPVTDHKGETIANRLKSCMIEWGVDKIFTVTVDNASSNDNAIKLLKEKLMTWRDDALILGGEFMHVRCCAHILNLIVKDGLEEIDSSVNAIRNAVKYLRSSDIRFQSFQRRLPLGNKVTRGSFVLDVNTRWNSTYLMLEAALKFRTTFDLMAANDIPYAAYFSDVTMDGPPLHEDWNKASRLKIFLEMFYESTLAFSATKTVTSSSCYDEICSIEEALIRLSNDPDPKVRNMAPPMREKFDKYWDGLVKINPMLIVASVFDPRSKMAYATTVFEQMYGKDSSIFTDMKEKVESLLRKLFAAYKLSHSKNMDMSKQSESGQADGLVTNMTVGGSSSSRRRSIFSTIYQQQQSENQCANSPNELAIYLVEKVEVETANHLGRPYDLLNWWKVNSVKFPVLSEVARDVLAIPVSTVSSESAFSTAGRILDPYRSSLTPPMVEVLILSQNWIRTAFLSDKQKSIQQMLNEHEFMGSLVEGNLLFLSFFFPMQI